MSLFRKKPVVIEAVQWFGKYTYPGGEWPDWFRDQVNAVDQIRIAGDYSLSIQTLEGYLRASIGDWVIKGTKGEFYPCKPDIFAETYEAVTDDSLQTARTPQTQARRRLSKMDPLTPEEVTALKAKLCLCPDYLSPEIDRLFETIRDRERERDDKEYARKEWSETAHRVIMERDELQRKLDEALRKLAVDEKFAWPTGGPH